MQLKRLGNISILKLTNNTDSESDEEFITKLYESKGYQVIKLDLQNLLDKTVLSIFPFLEKVFYAGVPDFFMFKAFIDFTLKTETPKVVSGDFFFVEVKHDKSSLQMNQIDWCLQHQELPIIIAIINNKENGETDNNE